MGRLTHNYLVIGLVEFALVALASVGIGASLCNTGVGVTSLCVNFLLTSEMGGTSDDSGSGVVSKVVTLLVNVVRLDWIPESMDIICWATAVESKPTAPSVAMGSVWAGRANISRVYFLPVGLV